MVIEVDRLTWLQRFPAPAAWRTVSRADTRRPRRLMRRAVTPVPGAVPRRATWPLEEARPAGFADPFRHPPASKIDFRLVPPHFARERNLNQSGGVV
jgi:hypothetical protein